MRHLLYISLLASLAAICCVSSMPVHSQTATAVNTQNITGHEEGHETHLREQIATYLKDHGLPPGAVVVIISTLPIVELRGAVPVGINLLEVKWYWVYILAVLGNMIPVPFILLLLGPISRICMKVKIGRIFFDWLFARTRRKSASIEKYETLGLTIFVAIPLPVTGAWTGAMAAFLMGVKFHHAMLSIFLGVLCAGVIMTVLSLLGWIGAAIAGTVLIILVVASMSKWLNREQELKNIEVIQ